MPVNYGSDAQSRPAVYNEKNTGVSPNDAGPLSDVQAWQKTENVVDQQARGTAPSDESATSINQESPSQYDTPIRVGRVLLAFPFIHCYKVQLSGRQGTCVATAIGRASHSPIGVKAADVIPPNSMVMIWHPRDATIGYIIGVLPTPTLSNSWNIADYIQQGGNSGVKKVEAYRNAVKAPKDALGWVPQSSSRPIDGTANEYVRMSETGIGLLIDSFQAYLRVNEVCGLWLNYFDNYAKLSALSLNILSYCEHNLQFYDEGELFSLKGYPTYPWEGTGTYSSGIKFSKTNGVTPVQMDKEFPFATEDVKDYAQTPIYRMTDYTGYIGQGFNRTLVRPAKESGIRKFTDSDNDIGLFQELVALDGSYSVRSAKQITLAKYPLIPNPRRIRQAEDALGDDLTRRPNYRFSGVFGGGREHKVEDWQDPAASGSAEPPPYLLRPAGVLDLIAHHYNWKSTHPFYYHTKDYRYPEESETRFSTVKFLTGNSRTSYINNFNKKILRIDDRYKEVTYYNTASFISMLEDGSIVLGDGYGSQITLTGGQIRLEAGGDVIVASGSRVVTLAKENIVRTKGSIDFSSTERDIRMKAENNLQLLGGNSGVGGVLIESKARGIEQRYRNRIGERVQGSGIILLSKGGSVSTIAKDIYQRAGVSFANPESFGTIISDCGKGKGIIASYGKLHAFFNSRGLGIWQKPVSGKARITDSHFFGPGYSKIDGPLLINKNVVISKKGSLGVAGNILCRKNGLFLRRLACRGGTKGVGATNGKTAKLVNGFIGRFAKLDPRLKRTGRVLFKALFRKFIWKNRHPGNNNFIRNDVGFSFRDLTPLGTPNVYGYREDGFFLLEMRWQQLRRTGLANGSGEEWVERPVRYQGNRLYPWPGKLNWIDRQAFAQYRNRGQFLLFDVAGYAKDREGNVGRYESPTFQSFLLRKCNFSYRL